jgi:hypothetical protein
MTILVDFESQTLDIPEEIIDGIVIDEIIFAQALRRLQEKSRIPVRPGLFYQPGSSITKNTSFEDSDGNPTYIDFTATSPCDISDTFDGTRAIEAFLD